jgi:hypothetical protein
MGIDQKNSLDNRDDVGLINFERNRTHDCVNRDHEPGVISSTDENAFCSTQGAVNHLDAATDG